MTSAPNERLRVGESFVDAFYSFRADRLRAIVVPGRHAERVLYYQAWAEAAHYVVQHRPACFSNANGLVECTVTVTDDLGTALGYTASDTFRLNVRDGQVADVTFEGDDPPIFNEVFAWLRESRPEVFSGPCKDMFDGGTTPAACARSIAQGARDFMTQHR